MASATASGLVATGVFRRRDTDQRPRLRDLRCRWHGPGQLLQVRGGIEPDESVLHIRAQDRAGGGATNAEGVDVQPDPDWIRPDVHGAVRHQSGRHHIREPHDRQPAVNQRESGERQRLKRGPNVEILSGQYQSAVAVCRAGDRYLHGGDITRPKESITIVLVLSIIMLTIGKEPAKNLLSASAVLKAWGAEGEG